MANFKVISLNCHGFNIGTAQYLRRICLNTDVILLQETWLSDVNCSRISDEFSDFVLYHNSAMEDRMASGIRRGRPFGGTAILVHKRLNKYCHKICTYNAAVCTVECQIKGYSLVLGSIYMPCDDGSQEHVDDYEAGFIFREQNLLCQLFQKLLTSFLHSRSYKSSFNPVSASIIACLIACL